MNIKPHSRRFYKLLLLSAMLLYMSFVSISLSGCVAAPLVVASEVGMTGMVFASSPIVGATVTVYNAATGIAVTTATTVAGGTYSVSGLPTDATYYVVATGGTVNGNPVNPYVYLLSVFNPQASNNPKTATGSYIVDLNENITVASLSAMVQNGATTSPISVNSSGQVSINTISTTIINNAATTINSTFTTNSSNYNSSSAPPSLLATAPNANTINALGNALASCVNTSTNYATWSGATGGDDMPSTDSVTRVVNVLMAPISNPASVDVNVSTLNTLATGYETTHDLPAATLSTATSVAYTVSGTVNGGYGPLAGAAVNLYEVLPTYSSSPLAAATTDSSGSYSFTYTYALPSTATILTAAAEFFVTAKASSGNLLYTAFNGSQSTPASITADIDELTSAQFAYYLNSVSGSMTTSGMSIPSSGVSNFTSGIASISETLPSSLSSSADEIYEVASALASCVQSSTSYCSNSVSLLPSSYVEGHGLFAYDLVLEYSATEAKALLAINADMASTIPPAWVVPVSVTVPSAPASLTATPGNTQVSLSWSAVTGATSYNVYDSTSSSGSYTKVASSTNTNSTVTGLTNGTAYYFVVTAVNNSGESGYSNQASATPPSSTYSAGSYPYDIAIDHSGNVWVTNYDTGYVTELNSSGATISTYNVVVEPTAIAIDSSGNVWVTDNYGINNNYDSLMELNSSGKVIGAYNAGAYAEAIAIDAKGNVWVVNTFSGTTVTERNSSGAVIGGPYAVGSFPVGIAIDAKGNVWVTNEGNGTAGTASGDSNVTELSSSGAFIGTYGAGSSPYAIAIDPSGNVWVTNIYSGKVTELNSSGVTIGTYTVGSGPDGIAIDSSGDVWVANEGSYNVTELVKSSGYAPTTYAAGLGSYGIAIDSSGDVWVANESSSSVTEIFGVAKGPQYFPYSGPQYP